MKKSALGMLVVVLLAAIFVSGCDRIKRTVELPDLTKSTIENAKISLDKRGLNLVVEDSIFSDDIQLGLIAKQYPLALSDVYRGTDVKIWVSKGSDKVEIPALENADLNDVLRTLAGIGLYSKTVFVYSDVVDKDDVISLDPAPGTKVEKDSYVEVKVSMGPEAVKTVVVPKATGMSKSSAKKKIEDVGLVANFVYRVHTEYYEGTLYYQTPKAGSVVPTGSTVTVYIATVLD
ncbi:PASTA domain-containing protein [candidate division WOR-3 bacterium]|nr:PASTA domain-containing protein [candidate division WOR-3 bacterium]